MTKPMHKREAPRVVGVGSDKERAEETAVDLIDKLGGYENMISQGAEGRVFAVTFLTKPAIVKQRFKKTYRHPTLDAKITRARLVGETRALIRARRLGVPTPSLLYVDARQNAIYMERVAGRTLKELIREGMSEADMEEVGTQVGKHVAAMHDGGLIHGDLTTSNILVVRDEDVDEPKNAAAKPRVVLIDFGLASNSIVPEDKGVDLYVLERAITVTHAAGRLFEAVMREYKKASGLWSASFNKFAEVRMRGRKRSMIG
jgi:TP53 regulating kinase-like protein